MHQCGDRAVYKFGQVNAPKTLRASTAPHWLMPTQPKGLLDERRGLRNNLSVLCVKPI